jgi:hypothetical protein
MLCGYTPRSRTKHAKTLGVGLARMHIARGKQQENML